jgi:hypothetical protein
MTAIVPPVVGHSFHARTVEGSIEPVARCTLCGCPQSSAKNLPTCESYKKLQQSVSETFDSGARRVPYGQKSTK